MTDSNHIRALPVSNAWYRIPDGTKVKHRADSQEGVIDGLTEIVSGSNLNADGKTQYRVRMLDSHEVRLIPDHELLFIADTEKLVVILRQTTGYRTYVTERLRVLFTDDRFVS
jgi:hypothetical protein